MFLMKAYCVLSSVLGTEKTPVGPKLASKISLSLWGPRGSISTVGLMSFSGSSLPYEWGHRSEGSTVPTLTLSKSLAALCLSFSQGQLGRNEKPEEGEGPTGGGRLFWGRPSTARGTATGLALPVGMSPGNRESRTPVRPDRLGKRSGRTHRSQQREWRCRQMHTAARRAGREHEEPRLKKLSSRESPASGQHPCPAPHQATPRSSRVRIRAAPANRAGSWKHTSQGRARKQREGVLRSPKCRQSERVAPGPSDHKGEQPQPETFGCLRPSAVLGLDCGRAAKRRGSGGVGEGRTSPKGRRGNPSPFWAGAFGLLPLGAGDPQQGVTSAVVVSSLRSPGVGPPKESPHKFLENPGGVTGLI